jgi:hypothetical protein
MGSLATSGPPSARALLRRQFRIAHDLLEAAIDRLPAGAVHRRLLGPAAPAGACYARVVVCEDLIVNGMLAAATPLALSDWIGRTGLSELPPPGRPADGCAWSRRVRLDLAAFRPYARAVYAATDAYLAALPDEQLDPAWGELPACLLTALLLTLVMRRGEIACLLTIERRPTTGKTEG